MENRAVRRTVRPGLALRRFALLIVACCICGFAILVRGFIADRVACGRSMSALPGRHKLYATRHPLFVHQTRQAFSGIIGWPVWQPKAFPNSSKLRTTPSTRKRPGECGSVFAPMREI
jgi:hypothetical protein